MYTDRLTAGEWGVQEFVCVSRRVCESGGRGSVCVSRGDPGADIPPVDRQTPVKTLPCPKLHLRAVKRDISNS